MMKGLPRYGEAKRHADALVGDLAKGSQVTALTPGQANDALAAMERLEAYRRSTGRTVSLLRAVLRRAAETLAGFEEPKPPTLGRQSRRVGFRGVLRDGCESF
jgi:hypothetical protein